MLYLLDANTLITAHNSYLAINRVPQFWTWLVYMGKSGSLKIPFEIIEEIKEGGKKDLLYDWIREKDHLNALLLDEEMDPDRLQRVINEGYADDLKDDELETIGQDPFLVAYAIGIEDRCVVTNEVSKPGKKRQNRKIPDVCSVFNVRCCNTVTLINDLDFRTSWQD